MDTLTFEKRENYGEIRFYPKCKKSRFFCDLCGRKTFHAQQLVDIRDYLGYDIEIEGYTLPNRWA